MVLDRPKLFRKKHVEKAIFSKIVTVGYVLLLFNSGMMLLLCQFVPFCPTFLTKLLLKNYLYSNFIYSFYVGLW